MFDFQLFRYRPVGSTDGAAVPHVRVHASNAAQTAVSASVVRSVFEALRFSAVDGADAGAEGAPHRCAIRISVASHDLESPAGPCLAEDERGRLYGTAAGWTWCGPSYQLKARHAECSVHLVLAPACAASPFASPYRPSAYHPSASPVIAYGLRHALTSLLPFTGWIPIHGAALRRNDTGVLITGPSGSGKSTLAAGLVARGWTCASDDLLMVPPRSASPADRSVLHGLSRGVRLLPDARSRLMPDLAETGAIRTSGDSFFGAENKDWFDLPTSAPVTPSTIILPEIVDAGTSRLCPVAPHVGLRALLEQMPPVATLPPRAAQSVIQTAGRLVRDAEVVALRAGRDLYDDPGTLSDLILDAHCYA
jgi:hypothetical protein